MRRIAPEATLYFAFLRAIRSCASIQMNEPDDNAKHGDVDPRM
jgi:hypothetical protein